MSIAIWPPVSPEERRVKVAEALQREVDWITRETIDACRELKHGLDDCYALLAPIDPGSTLVMSTPRNERVKGTITRVGSRIVKGSLNLQFRTLPPQSIALSPSSHIHIHALDALHTNLTQAIDLLALDLARETPHDAPSLASTLTLISDSLAESIALLKGPPLNEPDPSWQTSSCPPHHFTPPLPPTISVHFALQESSIVLSLRALEPVDAPVHFGTKLGLAIGTVRRLEHDESDVVFRYRPSEVYVREKVRIESADPSLISLHSKLGYLSHMLSQMRSNLAVVMSAAGLDE
ncbi:rogdi leucine zipper containing protein [Hirsutella rhossiliensis]|uniref:Rogdi leucine zipper containing protein n=1 Tax=Hirsutella rhossiliensis TaxID=111463 RepID=A0A9P8N363_9HYPO|nr:rogdi leucine zipper containing protein [Hirsutella rhossiliensis]KAH0963867.1 rogdi leucine zipper containing protein [Hirsutella rhossiliensis]